MSPYNRGYRAMRRREQQGKELADIAIQAEEIAGDKSGPISQTQGLGSAKAQPAPIKQEELPLAATPNQVVDITDREWSKALEFEGEQFAAAVKRLQDLPLTRQGVEIAKEFDTDAIKYIEKVNASKGRKLADAAHQLHIFHTGILKKLLAGPNAVRDAARSFIIRFDQAERRRLAEEQRAREEEIRRQQEEERQAEADALAASGHTEEAEVLIATPLPPVVAPPAKEATKIEGISVVYRVKLKRIADPKRFIDRVLAPNPSMLPMLFKEQDAAFTKWLTAQCDTKTGQMSITPEDIGIEIELSGGTRHRTGE